VPGLTGVVAVAAGRDMSYAVMANGTMMAWGGNSYGEVGDGTTSRRLTPVAVSGLTNVVEVSGGRDHALVVRENGSMWAWGANERGQLGIGSTANRSTPVQVLASGVRHVDAGAEHSIAVMTDGTVRTWGRGQRGQLGLGSTSNRTTPTTVPGLTGIVEIGDGRDQGFAMNAAGEVWGWGYNDFGQLGDGTTAQRNSPVRINGLSGITIAQGGRGMTIFLSGSDVDPPDPDVSPPSAPGVPVVSSTVSGRADLSWAAADDDRASTLMYLVYRDGGSSPVGSVDGPTSGTISFADVGLVPGSEHTYRVRASDGPNLGPLSPVSDPVTIAGGGGGGGGGGVVLLEDDFSGGLSAWSTSGPITVDSSAGSPSAPSALVDVNGAAAQARRNLVSDAASACVSAEVRMSRLDGWALYTLMRLRSSSGSSMARVEVKQNGRLYVRADAVGTRFTVGETLPFGSWHEVRLCVTSGALRLELDGVEVGSWSVGTGSQPLRSVQIGDTGALSVTANWDSLVVTDGFDGVD